MKKSQNTTALILMVVSLALLATSQWFWLKSEYNEQKRAFYSNSDLLFKETVRTIEDSLVSKVVVKAFQLKQKEEEKKTPPPSPQYPRKKPIILLKGTSSSFTEIDSTTKPRIRIERIVSDSALSSRISSDSTLWQIFIDSKYSATQDTLNSLKRIVAQLPTISLRNSLAKEPEKNQDPHKPKRRFSFLSAPIDSIDNSFNQKIKELGYPVEFSIKKDSIILDSTHYNSFRSIRSISEIHRKLRSADDSVIVNGVKILNPETVSSYSIVPNIIFEATPIDLNDYLFDKLQNNIFFSSLLLLITGLTFFLIYRSLQKQARLNILKNELISNVTHELKTPLATLSVALEALQHFGASGNPQTTKEYLEISQNEVNRLSLMVDNILKASLLEKQAISINPQPLDLSELLTNLAKQWQPRFEQLKGSLLTSFSGNDFIIEADELHVIGILNNLIDNAIKYSIGAPTVNIAIKSHLKTVTIKVKDDGIGIPKEYQDQVFEKFFRVPMGDRHNVKGYGLGLNFVKHIMDLHQGLITLESGNQGSEFVLTFRKKL